MKVPNVTLQTIEEMGVCLGAYHACSPLFVWRLMKLP
jgi:hypothetical protein